MREILTRFVLKNNLGADNPRRSLSAGAVVGNVEVDLMVRWILMIHRWLEKIPSGFYNGVFRQWAGFSKNTFHVRWLGLFLGKCHLVRFVF